MTIMPSSLPWRILMEWNPLDLWREKSAHLLFAAILSGDQHLAIFWILILVFGAIVILNLTALLIIALLKHMNVTLSTNPPYLWILMDLRKRISFQYWTWKCIHLIIKCLFFVLFVHITHSVQYTKKYSVRSSLFPNKTQSKTHNDNTQI